MEYCDVNEEMIRMKYYNSSCTARKPFYGLGFNESSEGESKATRSVKAADLDIFIVPFVSIASSKLFLSTWKLGQL